MNNNFDIPNFLWEIRDAIEDASAGIMSISYFGLNEKNKSKINLGVALFERLEKGYSISTHKQKLLYDQIPAYETFNLFQKAFPKISQFNIDKFVNEIVMLREYLTKIVDDSATKKEVAFCEKKLLHFMRTLSQLERVV